MRIKSFLLFIFSLWMILLFTCKNNTSKEKEDDTIKVLIKSITETDESIEVLFNQDSQLINLSFEKPFICHGECRFKIDTLNELSEFNFLKKKEIYSMNKEKLIWSESYFEKKKRWILKSNYYNSDDKIKELKYIVDGKTFFKREFDRAGNIKSTESLFLIDFTRKNNNICATIEQPGYELMDFKYKLLADLKKTNTKINLKNITKNSEKGIGEICINTDSTVDSVYFACELMKIKSVINGENTIETNEVLQFRRWIPSPEENVNILLR